MYLWHRLIVHMPPQDLTAVPVETLPGHVGLALGSSSVLMVLLARTVQAGQLGRGEGVKPHHGLQSVQLHVAPMLLGFQAQVLKQVSLQTKAILK